MYGIEHLTGFAPVEARGRKRGDRPRRRARLRAADDPGRHRRHERRHGRPVGPPRAGRRHACATTAPGASTCPTGCPTACASPARRSAPSAPCPAKAEAARRQAVRLLLRGRDDQGRAPVGVGGLRLARALEALHDRDDGAVPGQDVPPQLRPPHGPRARRRPRRGAGRRHHRPPAPQPHELLAPGRARLRAREAHRDPPLARRARRQDALGRRLEARPTTTAAPRTRPPPSTSRSA